ncbi:MAG: hypothetical protein LBV79_01875 [Candidatus Adiutrix sp.]|nr:hypothetical protein [Candidatus Adiutrix sp.]
MAEILANVTQVINNSPQINSLVGGHVAAAEEARRLARLEESQRQERELKSRVLALEESSVTGESDPDGQQRRESRREQRRRRQARAGQPAAGSEAVEPLRPASPYEARPIIDVCV